MVKTDQEYAETQPRNLRRAKRDLLRGAKSTSKEGIFKSKQFGNEMEGSLDKLKPIKANLLENPQGLNEEQKENLKKRLLQEDSCQFSTDLQLYISKNKAEED